MADPFASYPPTLSGPARGAVAVTPSDSNDLASVSRALYVGRGGNLKLTCIDGSTETFENFPGGLLDVRVKRVWATGTTATAILALV